MTDHPWFQEFSGSITVCDTKGIIVEMNDASVQTFQEQGGKNLIGTNVLDCHPEPSKSKLKHLLENRQTNVYTLEKNGVKKLVYQIPWFKNGVYGGLVELVLEIPHTLPHFIRNSSSAG